MRPENSSPGGSMPITEGRGPRADRAGENRRLHRPPICPRPSPLSTRHQRFWIADAAELEDRPVEGVVAAGGAAGLDRLVSLEDDPQAFRRPRLADLGKLSGRLAG